MEQLTPSSEHPKNANAVEVPQSFLLDEKASKAFDKALVLVCFLPWRFRGIVLNLRHLGPLCLVRCCLLQFKLFVAILFMLHREFLRMHQSVVHARLDLEQLVVCALFHQRAFPEHHNLVSPLDGRQSMRNDNRRPVLRHAVERFLHNALGPHVDGTGGFVQDEDRRPLDDTPGDGNPLALTAREPDAAFANNRVVALQHSH